MVNRAVRGSAMNLPLIDQQREFAVGEIPATGLASSFERRRLRAYLAQILADIAIMFVAYLVAHVIYLGLSFPRGYGSGTRPAQLVLPIYLTIALYNGTYSLPSLKDWKTATSRAITALAIAAALLNFIIFFVRLNADFSRTTFIIALSVAAVLMGVSRRLSVHLMQRLWGPTPVNVLVIEDGGPPIELRHAYRINAAERGLRPAVDDPQVLDLFARYVCNMDQVIVSCEPDRRMAWAMVLKGCGVSGEVLSDFMREIGALGLVHRDEIGMTTLLVSTGPLGLRARALKRAVDVGASLAALTVALPVLLLAAAAIKLEDGGPVLFRQNRVGRRNQMFSIYKLRTMKVHRADGDGRRSASKDDDRVTRVGRFLRRTSIDELPQLLNVLKGEMSLVGPRPHAIGSLAGDKLFWEVDPRYWQRHSLRPGLTGLAQIRGLRGATDREVDLTSRLQADLEYLSGWTIWRDVRILLATSTVLLHDRAF
jgi:exopolysaccharide biosynthesis polyprenyl glycosylphosphotransferase